MLHRGLFPLSRRSFLVGGVYLTSGGACACSAARVCGFLVAVVDRGENVC